MTHSEHCSCGHEHSHEHAHPHKTDHRQTELTENQKVFLHQLSHSHYLPVARFTLKDSRETSFASTALAPVFIRSATDDMATVKEAGAFLLQLEALDLITLDYDIPLDGYKYEEYHGSALYEYFCKTVQEGASRPNFLGDTPLLELGSMSLKETEIAISSTCCGHDAHPHGE